jgi:hypothetical protein
VSRTRTRSSLSRDLDAWANDFPAIPASQNCSKNPTTRADPLFEKRTDANPTVSRAAHPSIIHGTEAPLCSGSQSHGRGGATRRGRWMGTGPGSRHAKNLMRGTKQRKGNAGCKRDSETKMHLLFPPSQSAIPHSRFQARSPMQSVSPSHDRE